MLRRAPWRRQAGRRSATPRYGGRDPRAPAYPAGERATLRRLTCSLQTIEMPLRLRSVAASTCAAVRQGATAAPPADGDTLAAHTTVPTISAVPSNREPAYLLIRPSPSSTRDGAQSERGLLKPQA